MLNFFDEYNKPFVFSPTIAVASPKKAQCHPVMIDSGITAKFNKLEKFQWNASSPYTFLNSLNIILLSFVIVIMQIFGIDVAFKIQFYFFAHFTSKLSSLLSHPFSITFLTTFSFMVLH